jgi:hypothetical protein
VSTILPLIVVPDEVQSGTDLVGNAFSPHGGVQVTVRVGSHVLWRSGVGDNDTDFCVPIPDGATGVVTVEAEDSQGNHNIANVPIVP